mmetsp:Transcript_54001/g.144439  ORF Transcript_54001/g.144439 Transcript_54001/m.144439 type:complete len:104 (-) Transcript_54001:399-710(-)
MFSRLIAMVDMKTFVKKRQNPRANIQSETEESEFERWLTKKASEQDSVSLREWLADSRQQNDTSLPKISHCMRPELAVEDVVVITVKISVVAETSRAHSFHSP